MSAKKDYHLVIGGCSAVGTYYSHIITQADAKVAILTNNTDLVSLKEQARSDGAYIATKNMDGMPESDTYAKNLYMSFHNLSESLNAYYPVAILSFIGCAAVYATLLIHIFPSLNRLAVKLCVLPPSITLLSIITMNIIYPLTCKLINPAPVFKVPVVAVVTQPAQLKSFTFTHIWVCLTSAELLTSIPQIDALLQQHPDAVLVSLCPLPSDHALLLTRCKHLSPERFCSGDVPVAGFSLPLPFPSSLPLQKDLAQRGAACVVLPGGQFAFDCPSNREFHRIGALFHKVPLRLRDFTWMITRCADVLRELR